MLGDHQHLVSKSRVLCSTGRTLMRLIWSLPRKPMSSARRLSYPSMRKWLHLEETQKQRWEKALSPKLILEG